MNGRVVRMNPRTGAQDTYATIPTSTYTAYTSMPVFMAFGRDGSLYVGEGGGQPMIWRVPAGGGQAQPWFVDPRLAGSWVGTVLGVAIDSTGDFLYFAAGEVHREQTAISRLQLETFDRTQVAHIIADSLS